MASGMETETVLPEANTDVLQSQILRGDGLNTQDPVTEVGNMLVVGVRQAAYNVVSSVVRQ